MKQMFIKERTIKSIMIHSFNAIETTATTIKKEAAPYIFLWSYLEAILFAKMPGVQRDNHVISFFFFLKAEQYMLI